MKKNIILFISFILFGLVFYNIFFSIVSFKYVYDGVVDFSNVNQADYKILQRQNVYIFTTKKGWDDFKNKYLGDGQIPNINFSKGQILLSYTDLTLDKGGAIYGIDNIRKNLLSLDVNLNEKGYIDSMTGFTREAKPKTVMIYNINAGILAKIYSAKINY